MFSGMNTTNQGTVGLGAAIAEFTKRGNTVSIPLVDGQKYDLIADDGKKLLKIQVKTCSYRDNRTGNYKVQLATNSKQRTNKFDKRMIDYVYILCDNGRQYLIPSKEINAEVMLTLTYKWNKYMI